MDSQDSCFKLKKKKLKKNCTRIDRSRKINSGLGSGFVFNIAPMSGKLFSWCCLVTGYDTDVFRVH